MDQATRNTLRNVVTQCRKLLEDATSEALQGRFGIYTVGRKAEVKVEDESSMGHLSEEDCLCRRDLVDHFEHIQVVGFKPQDALEQLVREIAFTHLNRLCAYKMMESRDLIREAISRGHKSQGFIFYLAEHPEDEKLHNTGHQHVVYCRYLDWLGGTLSEEIGVLFSPNDSANRIYPPQRVLDEVLTLINSDQLKDIWIEDETIGWIYQYFTPKELRDKARKESSAPRNSYELAFRNQFYTPRYVVEFLTDNTLGRIWYEMRKGETVLNECCPYLVRRPTEIFLREGDDLPERSEEVREGLSQEELLELPVYVPHRPKKDPREIKILDPACGSGHFLLYCFDLLQAIYEEAYDDIDVGPVLKRDYPSHKDLRRAIPGLILTHNLHAIDIDLRATQIAALALWLRCQRAFQDLELKGKDRPRITRSNIVCAEPMPGEKDLLSEFTATLEPKVLGQLLDTIFKSMELAGEAGSLLRIEEEISEAARNARGEYVSWKKHEEKARAQLFPELVVRDDPGLLDFADITDEAFLDRAEEEILAALDQYAERTANGKGLLRRLFADDAWHGLAFIDLSRKRYDVVLMNPPFGSSSERSAEKLHDCYPESFYDLAATFFEMALSRTTDGGRLGAIANRTIFYTKRLSGFRQRLLRERELDSFVDLGSGVLDALVEAALSVFESSSSSHPPLFADCTGDEHKNAALDEHVNGERPWIVRPQEQFLSGNAELSYQEDASLRSFGKPIGQSGFDVRQGLASGDNFRFLRLRWEVPGFEIGRTWFTYSKGGDYAPFYYDLHLLVDWSEHTQALYRQRTTQFSCLITKNSSKFAFRPGLTYATRTTSRLSVRVMHSGCLFDTKGSAIFSDLMHRAGDDSSDLIWLICVLNSDGYQSLIDSRSGALDSAARSYGEGLISSLPFRSLASDAKSAWIERARSIIHGIQSIYSTREPCALFLRPDTSDTGSIDSLWQKTKAETAAIWHQAKSLSSDSNLHAILFGEDCTASSDSVSQTIQQRYGDLVHEALATGDKRTLASGLVSYALGSSFGRWDVRYTTGHRQPPPLPDPFDSLQACPPGILRGPNGLPAIPKDVPTDYPVRIDWDGVLVDDSGHEDDIVRSVRDVLEIICKDRAEAIEEEVCEILGIRDLRDYFSKPGNGGFWMDHVKRYSKSRRKAPIYWYLRSAKGNYGLWLYYHRLDRDILFKALVNYVEPKIRLEEERMNTLRAQKIEAGSSGREAKRIERDLDQQDQFVSELRDFADKLRRAADLHLSPDLNDGVVLNVAPLWEVVPWKDAKKHWEDLVEGQHEWSSIGRQLREKGFVKA